MRRRAHLRLATALVAAWALAACRLSATVAADLPPAVVAGFTRGPQPLLLNKCSAGACHGGAEAAAPRFARPRGGAGPDAATTRANIAAFLDAVGPQRDPRPLVTLLATRHPAGDTRFVAAPLTARERSTLESWLAAVRAAELPGRFDPAVTPAAATVEPAPQTNRFRALLDAAANPPELPPPQEAPGIIFGRDDPAEGE